MSSIVETAERKVAVQRRVDALFDEMYGHVARRTDRLLVALMIVQWLAGIALSLVLSPTSIDGAPHRHVIAAVLLGGIITSLPVMFAVKRPGAQSTRYVIGIAQMLSSALLIHLSGGRIETHFHVFASLAILAFYRDLKVLIPATIVVAGDHFVRGIVWPESVYGIVNPEWWRFLEHAGWVVFLDVFLLYNCVKSRAELADLARRQVELEDSKEAMSRVERLAAVGQLAASVGHELRNPLAAVRNAHAFIEKRLTRSGVEDARITEFLALMRRELDASGKIIGNLLDFSRPKEPVLGPVHLRPLVDELISVIRNPSKIQVENEIPSELPTPEADKDQLRQVLGNLVQNAVEAIGESPHGKVLVSAAGGDGRPFEIRVADNGPGMSPDVLGSLFQPLFSTKTKGTGLGLAVVRGIVERHGGTIRVQSRVGEGTTFTIELPARHIEEAALAAE